MIILHRSSKLLLSAFRRNFSPELCAVFHRFCSAHRARFCTSYSRQRFGPYLSCNPYLDLKLFNSQVFSPHLDLKRFYSQVFNDNDPVLIQGVTQDDSPEMDSERTHYKQRSSETFSLDVLVSLLRQENAMDVCVIKVPEQINYADYFIVASGMSARHLRAMALYAIKVYKFLKKDRDPNVKIEGKDSEDWICIDFGNMMVHFMLPETREAYELEKLWTLREYDEKLMSMPTEALPEDFIYDAGASE